MKQIHARLAHAVCYVDAGTWENWRPDAARYPKQLLGKGNGWPGERWLDIRATKVLLPLIDARVAKCAKAGFDAVDFDNVDGYANTTGFPLTGAAQLTFNKAIAGLAHKRGMSVGLKNDLDQLGALRTSFDFAVNEQCFPVPASAASTTDGSGPEAGGRDRVLRQPQSDLRECRRRRPRRDDQGPRAEGQAVRPV